PTVVAQLQANRIAESEWPQLEDPGTAARFLGRFYLATFRRFGLLIDESAYVTTIDPDYQAFIGWQFRRLHDRGVLVQAPHFSAVCPVCGPVSVDASETDLSAGGDAERVIYQLLPFELDDGRILLAATLRPETVFGATNLWLPPTEPLVVWHLGSVEYLVGRVGGTRLVEQHGGRLGKEEPVAPLLGRRAVAPLTGVRVPLLPSILVDPRIGTAVVMSVPAHAPADWLGVQALDAATRSTLPPVVEIVTFPAPDGWSASETALLAGSGAPAERAVRATGARTLSDRAALDEATERLYRIEFVRGTMREDLLGGRPVAEARTEAIAALRAARHGLELHEFSKPVICRNGHEVVIRKVPDQWFIHYSDLGWKDATRALVGRMTFTPPEYGEELTGILDWLGDRACVRRGRWLGTPFPFAPDWVIEPIADSTFYPAYFIVRRYVSSGRLGIEQLTDALFDFVFLGVGPGGPGVGTALQQELRDEFLYWYPLDINIGGKEHKRVHFPVFLATHALLLPPPQQPRSIFVHWWVTGAGGAKISKKDVGKGGTIPPTFEAFERWGADAVRLYHAQAASAGQDVEWDPSGVDAAQTRLVDIERVVREFAGPAAAGPPELDRWLEAAWHDLVNETTTALDDRAIRRASELVYARAPALLRRYLARGGAPGPVPGRVIESWIRLLSPVTPHLAEELGEGVEPRLVAERDWPAAAEFVAHPGALAAEEYLDRVEDDLRNVAELARGRGEPANAVQFYVAAPWKSVVEAWLREGTAGGHASPTIRELMSRAETHPELAAFRPQIPAYVQRVLPQLRGEPRRDVPALDERALLRAAEGYLSRRFHLESVVVFDEREAEDHDPHNRRARARPGRPAFFLIGPPGPRSAPS
ncbi:MAG: class I tRNA ligase family protein, partial [Thermoplasmata archaeon]|nr:class I tRNA ligase family protein [Thermoplasmata archaeon]